jgi:hypothetical protein
VPLEVSEPGRVVLDVSWADFTVARGEPGSSLRLEGTYDQDGFELEETLESYGERGWIYRLRLSRRGMQFTFSDEETHNRLRLTLPPGVPIALEGSIGPGQSELDLGGLWIVDLELATGLGQHVFRFDAPLEGHMNRFHVDGRIGELRVESLGNASPTSAEVSLDIGELTLDLTGAWRGDAEVVVRSGIGESTIRLPRGVAVEIERAGVLLGESVTPEKGAGQELAPGAPKLRLSAHGTLGAIRLEE